MDRHRGEGRDPGAHHGAHGILLGLVRPRRLRAGGGPCPSLPSAAREAPSIPGPRSGDVLGLRVPQPREPERPRRLLSEGAEDHLQHRRPHRAPLRQRAGTLPRQRAAPGRSFRAPGFDRGLPGCQARHRPPLRRRNPPLLDGTVGRSRGLRRLAGVGARKAGSGFRPPAPQRVRRRISQRPEPRVWHMHELEISKSAFSQISRNRVSTSAASSFDCARRHCARP